MSASPHIVDPLLHFLEVCIHTLLCARGVYPRELFERRSQYGCTVWMCRAPEVCEGLRRCLADVRPHLLANAVEGLCIPLLDPATGAAHARYLFDVDLAHPQEDASALDVEQQLAAAVVALQALECAPPVPAGTTWTVQLRLHLVEVEAAGGGRAGKPAGSENWVRHDEPAGGAGGSGSSSSSSSSGRPVLRKPLKTVRLNRLYLAVAVEDGLK